MVRIQFDGRFISKLTSRDVDLFGVGAHVWRYSGRLVVSALLFISSAQAQVISGSDDPQPYVQRHAQEIGSIASQLNQRFPPDRYHLIIIGRSLTLLAAYLDATGSRPFTSLPLSDVKDSARIDDATRDSYYFPHFASHIPSDIGGRQVVMIDYEASGVSLTMAQILLTRYFGSLGREGVVHSVGLKARHTWERTYLGDGVDHPPVRILLSDRLERELEGAAHKQFSRIGRFFPYGPTADLNGSGAPDSYQALVRAFQLRLGVAPSWNPDESTRRRAGDRARSLCRDFFRVEN